MTAPDATDDGLTTDSGFNFQLRGQAYRGYQDGTVEIARGGIFEPVEYERGMQLLLDPDVEWVDSSG